MKKSLIAVALIAASSFAQATTVTYADTQLNPTLQNAANRTDWSSFFNLAYFDASIGSLNSVSLTLTGRVASLFTVQNTGPNARMATATSKAEITTDIAGLNITPAGTGSLNVGPGETVVIGPVNATDSVTIAGFLSDWTGTGSKSIAVQSWGTSFVSGSGNFRSQIETWANATLSVTYDYTEPVVTQVPEPASLALFAAGLIGLSAARRRKA